MIGDAACFLGADGKPLPGVSPTAMQMGRFVANVHRARSQAPQPSASGPSSSTWTKAAWRPSAAHARCAEAKGIKLSGVLAWLAWLLVHIWYLVGFRNRFVVFFDWAWSYFTYRRGARLITGGRLLPGAPETLAAYPPKDHIAAQ